MNWLNDDKCSRETWLQRLLNRRVTAVGLEGDLRQRRLDYSLTNGYWRITKKPNIRRC